MLQYNLFKKKSFTIVELLISIVIGSILLAVIYRFLTNVQFANRKISAKANLQMNARQLFDEVVSIIRGSSEIIRPSPGETLPYIVLKDITNKITILYLEPNNQISKTIKKPVYKLIRYNSDYTSSYNPQNEKTLINSIKKLSFTSLSPNNVQVIANVIYENEEIQFILNIGIMNIGGLE